ncbi:MAG: cupin domain-containing protein [Cyclobacteriaceae bacterium]|nr:cupin domain-containing protein [Cyclobacteriaceae bacterium]
MQRRKFIATSAAVIPALAFSQHLSAQDPRTETGFVVKANESRFNESTLLFGGTSPNDIKVSGKDTAGNLTVFEYSGNVKGGPPLHIHENQDEIFFILSGEYTFKVGEELHHLTAGDTIFLPRKVPHCFAQTTDKGKMLFMFQPSGKMEDYFRKLATFKGMPTPEEGAKLFSDHEMKIVGPPLPY